jgi:hypothetical protein
MDCDFLIDKILLVEHTNGASHFVLRTKKGFYFGDEDEDETEEEAYKKFIIFLQNPRNIVIIYDDKRYTKQRYRYRYSPFILSIIAEEKKKDFGKNNIVSTDNINKMTLYERFRSRL